ncbi:MAG TPA: hypothetical protein VE441_08985 [Mycobacterium sp.]|jgi:hypothetical protein|nr:hypothetical protein [Mycobacterium sp.]
MTDERRPVADVRAALEQFFTVDPSDAGCEHAMALLDVYVDTVVAGRDPEATMPGITAHLRSCLPCRTDFEGLLAAVTANNDR